MRLMMTFSYLYFSFLFVICLKTLFIPLREYFISIYEFSLQSIYRHCEPPYFSAHQVLWQYLLNHSVIFLIPLQSLLIPFIYFACKKVFSQRTLRLIHAKRRQRKEKIIILLIMFTLQNIVISNEAKQSQLSLIQ